MHNSLTRLRNAWQHWLLTPSLRCNSITVVWLAVLALLLLGLYGGSAAAAEEDGPGVASLKQFFGGLEGMSSTFLQTVADPRGRILEEGEGVISVQRPGRFRLAYEKPHEQLYVADGERLWVYDRDLLQVTVRAQGDALDDTPALLLSEPERLHERFQLADLGWYDGMTWVELVPLEGEGSFERVLLAFRDDVLTVMDMADHFGQFTRLEFLDIQRNPELAAGLFRFEPPPGVDVISDEATAE